MDTSVFSEKEYVDLKTQWKLNAEKREIMWEEFFNKIEKIDVEDLPTLSIAEVPGYVHDENTMNYSNKVSEINLTEHEKEIVDKIQNNLQSTLNKLILQREKAKIMDIEQYSAIHLKTKKEIARLRKDVSKQDIITYVALCVNSKKDVEYLIENILHSDIKTTLVHKMKISLSTLQDDDLDNALEMEWNHLTKTLPEEDVIIYAVNVLKKNGF